MESFKAGNFEFKTRQGLDYYKSLQMLNEESFKAEWVKVVGEIRDGLNKEKPVKKQRVSSSSIVFN